MKNSNLKFYKKRIGIKRRVFVVISLLILVGLLGYTADQGKPDKQGTIIDEKKGDDVIQNKKNSSDSKLTDWLIAIGTISIPFLGFFFNFTQIAKMRQDRKFDREKQLLEVFRELGSSDPRIRIGAAAILLQRLDKIPNPKKKDKIRKKRKEEIYEFFSIMSVLIAETKHEEKENVQKFIADGIASALVAIIPEGKKSPDNEESPLKGYDFQGSTLHNAWWRRIDARGVDFYEASLERASLREAFLSEAILKKANLEMAVLEDADLRNTNLQESRLKGAKMARANLKGANLCDACLENANLMGAHIGKIAISKESPENGEIKEELKITDLSKACLKGADLRDVDLCDAIIDGADFTDAIFNNGTKLLEEQLKKAIFRDGTSEVVTILKNAEQSSGNETGT